MATKKTPWQAAGAGLKLTKPFPHQMFMEYANPGPVWGEVAKPAMAVFDDVMPIPTADYKPTPAPAPKLPILELNLAAKKASPFTQVTTIEELKVFRTNGAHLEYITKYNDRLCLSPAEEYGDMTLHSLITRGVYVHKHNKVVMFCAVKVKGLHDDIVIEMWSGTNIEQWMEFTSEVYFLNRIGALEYAIVEPNTVVAF